jgi:hypothetical protein
LFCRPCQKEGKRTGEDVGDCEGELQAIGWEVVGKGEKEIEADSGERSVSICHIPYIWTRHRVLWREKMYARWPLYLRRLFNCNK